MSIILVQLLWFGLSASIILVDANLMKKPIEPSTLDLDNVDLKDRSVGSFVIAMLIFGGFVIPFYLWYSRRTSAAVVAGIGLMLACGFVVALFSSALA